VYAGTRGTLDIADERVTPLMLDVTDAEQIQQAVRQVGSLDVLINNSGIAPYDDLSDPAVIEQTLAVNFFGMYKVSQAFLPMLKCSKGALVNNLSLMALAPLPLTPSYAISKAAALSMTQSLRALVASQGVKVHGVFLGPVDTDMTRGFDIPKASPESVAQGIFNGLENGEEDIFPDPMSQSIAEGWRTGVAKEFEASTQALCRRAWRLCRSAAHHSTLTFNKGRTEEERVMKRQDFTTSFTVDQSPEEVFKAVNNVRGWWWGEVDGDTGRLGGEFIYRYQNMHKSTQQVTEFVPGKKVVWHVTDAELTFVKDKSEWIGTDIVFEIASEGGKTELTFTHVGLVPAFECYGGCSGAWGALVDGNLRNLITTGNNQPDAFA
jgi:NAD(P)-dependent dehydrogenase (short-subunit alcohol dehydrogenase family)